jgi:hypothetical protein
VRLVGERALAAHEALHAEGLSNEGGMVVDGQCLGGNWVFEYGREGAFNTQVVSRRLFWKFFWQKKATREVSP